MLKKSVYILTPAILSISNILAAQEQLRSQGKCSAPELVKNSFDFLNLFSIITSNQ